MAPRLFFGKISKKPPYPQQHEQNFYAGGNTTSSWYNGLQVGDYVFPIYDSSVKKLWRVKSFTVDQSGINPDGAVYFDLIKEYSDPVAISSQFVRYRYFDLDLNMLNKCPKSTGTEKKAFFPISCSPICPPPDQIDFRDLRDVYFTLENAQARVTSKDGDVRMILNDLETMRIAKIQILVRGEWSTYDLLWNLYCSRTEEADKFGLRKLYEFAISDNASKKEKFLNAAIDDIERHGVFSIPSPVALYDSVFVGRRLSQTQRRELNVNSASEVVDDPELSLDDIETYREYASLLKLSPNLVLYGPPGTGKTYTAQRIVEAFEYDRTGKVKPFDAIQAEGRTTFVTFHQSFSYEEFVEGLRPVISESDISGTSDTRANLRYAIQPGVLLNIANRSAQSQIVEGHPSNVQKLSTASRIWKMSLGERGKDEEVYKSCIDTNTIAIGWIDHHDIGAWDIDRIRQELASERGPNDAQPINNVNSVNYFVNELQEGDLLLIFASVTSIRAIGMIDGPYEWWEKKVGHFAHRRKVRWLKVFDSPVDIRKYNLGKQLSMVTLYELTNVNYTDINDLINDGTKESSDQKQLVPYYLIIDEINRGNISKIFGELITLLEKDKREKLRITLPYSQKDFALPSNLYVIGTMNTADRSIAMLDIALRRRFIFKELEPNAQVVRSENPTIGELDLVSLFTSLNNKILNKLDRDHRLGHSYFLNVYRIEDFRVIWYYQIVPLLLEYFYNDLDALVSILTEAFFDRKNSRVRVLESDTEFVAALKAI